MGKGQGCEWVHPLLHTLNPKHKCLGVTNVQLSCGPNPVYPCCVNLTQCTTVGETGTLGHGSHWVTAFQSLFLTKNIVFCSSCKWRQFQTPQGSIRAYSFGTESTFQNNLNFVSRQKIICGMDYVKGFLNKQTPKFLCTSYKLTASYLNLNHKH